MIRLKTEEEIQKLRIGGQKLAKVLQATADIIKPGILTSELNDFAHKRMIEGGGKPSFLNYSPDGVSRPYPASLCVCINDEIVHGVPNEDPKEIKEGDIVTLDGGFIYEGLFTDHAITVAVGEVSKEINELIQRTKEALNAGIKQCVIGNRIGDISAAIEAVGVKSGLSVIHNLTGHGVGYDVHEDPYVPNEGQKGTGEVIEEGLVIALEPMFSLGKPQVALAKDGYTYVTEDGSISAQCEHTVAVTKDGPVVITGI